MEQLTDKDKAILKNLTNPDADKEYLYDFPREVQQQLLGCLLTDKFFFDQSMTIVKPFYFNDKAHQKIAKILFEYYHKYTKLPDQLVLELELMEQLEDNPAKYFFLAELDVVCHSYEPGLEKRDYLLDKITEFAKTQALRTAYSQTLDILFKNPPEKWSKIKEILQVALLVERNVDLGLNYFKDLDFRYDKMLEQQKNQDYFTCGFPTLNSALNGGLSRGEVAAWCGMCFAKGTEVLMFDGSTKAVQDVNVGDLLMGDDSKPRKVLKLSNGVDQLYRVVPVKGDPYVVNSKHILSLKNDNRDYRCKRRRKDGSIYIKPNAIWHNSPYKTPGTDIFNVPVEDFLKHPKSFQRMMKGWRTGVEFESKPVKIDPYMLGIWLGDGDKHDSAITNIDGEVISAVYQEAASRGLDVTHKGMRYGIVSQEQRLSPPGLGLSKNTLMNDLRSYGLLYSYRTHTGSPKHIPFDYKTNSRQVRLEVLAGLMDSDGSMSNNGFDFINKSKQLSDDVAFVARSLGLAAYVKPCKKRSQNGTEGLYWRVSISGDCSEIPTRILRKQCTARQQIKSVLVTGIKRIEPVGVGEYYGFAVDGNHLFLLSDFTVTHNSGAGKSLALVKTAMANLMQGRKVLYVSLEMDEYKTANRFDAQLADIPVMGLLQEKDEVIKALKAWISDFDDPNRLYIKQFAAGSADITTIRAYMSQLSLHGFVPDLVIVDYVGELKDAPGMKTYESRQRLVRDLRGLAVEAKICAFTAMQVGRAGREAMEKGYIDDSALADSQGQIRPLDALWSINQTDAEQQCGVGKIFVIKHRNGASRFTIYFQRNRATLDMSEISAETYKARMSEYQQKTSDNVDIDNRATKATKFDYKEKWAPNPSRSEVDE